MVLPKGAFCAKLLTANKEARSVNLPNRARMTSLLSADALVALRPAGGLSDHEVRQPQARHRPVEGRRPRGIDSGVTVQLLIEIIGPESDLVGSFGPAQVFHDVEVRSRVCCARDGVAGS